MQLHTTHLSALLLLALALLRTAPAQCQQTLFNVPTGASTAFGAVFAQERLNLARRAGASSTTFDVGLGHGLEAGINVAGITAYGRDASIGTAALGPCVMANIQESLAPRSARLTALCGRLPQQSRVRWQRHCRFRPRQTPTSSGWCWRSRKRVSRSATESSVKRSD